MLIYDYKFDPKRDPLSDFKLLVIFKDPALKSIRDLKQKDIPLLQKAKKQTLDFVKNKLGYSEDKVWLYFHYPPSFYVLHLHVVSIDRDFEETIGRCHLLSNVIFNL